MDGCNSSPSSLSDANRTSSILSFPLPLLPRPRMPRERGGDKWSERRRRRPGAHRQTSRGGGGGSPYDMAKDAISRDESRVIFSYVLFKGEGKGGGNYRFPFFNLCYMVLF